MRARRCGSPLTALGAVLILLVSLPAAAQDVYAPNEPARALKEGKIVRALRIKTSAPVIDGRLNDEVWTSAESASNFTQRDPDNGMPATEGSTLFVVWDLSKSDTSRPGSFNAFRDLGDAFRADANHVLMVKVSYWLNR